MLAPWEQWAASFIVLWCCDNPAHAFVDGGRLVTAAACGVTTRTEQLFARKVLPELAPGKRLGPSRSRLAPAILRVDPRSGTAKAMAFVQQPAEG